MVNRNPLFDSAWFKWGRAMHHARTLHEGVNAVLSSNGEADPLVSVQSEYHPRRHGFGVYASEVLGIPGDWGVLVGDIANNYRCAVDHLAWALVSRGRTPPEVLNGDERRGVAFPVAKSRQQFNRSLARRLPGVGRSDVSKVRAEQPYHHKGRAFRHNLVILVELNNRDKHRSIEPVWVHTTRLEVTITDRRDCVNLRARSLTPGQPLEVGAELAFIRVRKTGPEPHLDVRTRSKGPPSIKPRVGLIDWVTQTGAQIGLLLNRFSAVPDEVAEAAAWLAT
jgi:hypothetical protein